VHIAICGELGAGCTEVAQIMSKMLGMTFINSASIIKGIVVDFRGVHPEESFSEFERHVLSGEVDLDMMIVSKIDELLEQADTIVEGRSAFMLLSQKEVLKVLLVASPEIRAKHIAKRRKITTEEAMEAINISDTERKHMVEKMLKKDWFDPHLYDLIINTGLRSHQEVAELVCKLFQKKR
jgi:cytidylate kinase